MRNATYHATKVTRKYRAGAISTRAERIRNVRRIVADIEAQFRGIKLENIASRHVGWWVDAMKSGALSGNGQQPAVGTQKNLLSALRFLLKRLGKANLLPKTNAELGIAQRDYVRTVSVAIDVAPEQLHTVAAYQPRYALCLQLMRSLGLRCEESLKLVPLLADRGREVCLEGSWCKNGRPRCVPVLTAQQRSVLESAKSLAGEGSMVPVGLNYLEARTQLRGIAGAVGLNHRHGLRHAYAHDRYRILTGQPPPVLSGLTAADANAEQILRDRTARDIIARELGHSRRSVLGAYLGSLYRSGRRAQRAGDGEGD